MGRDCQLEGLQPSAASKSALDEAGLRLIAVGDPVVDIDCVK